MVSIENGIASQEAVYMHYRGTGITAAIVWNNGVIEADLSPIATTVPAGQLVTQAMSFAANDVRASGNGGAVTTDTSVTMPTVDQMRIGTTTAAGIALSGSIRRVVYWPPGAAQTRVQQIST
jgi:hypothetical protein